MLRRIGDLIMTIQRPSGMKGDSTTRNIRTLIAEHLRVEVERVTDEARFLDDLGADWLDRLELMIAVEDQFTGLEITDDRCAGGTCGPRWVNREGGLGGAAGKRSRQTTKGPFGPFVVRTVAFLRTADRLGASRIDRNSGASGLRGSRRATGGRSDPRSARGGHRAVRRRREPARASSRRGRRRASSGANGSRAFS